MIFYSKSTNSAYDDNFKSLYDNSNSWPLDAVEISKEVHEQMFISSNDGYHVEPDNEGKPVLVENNIDPKDSIKGQIISIEETVTNRRLREANLTAEGKAWLQGVDNQIAALRTQL